MKVYIETFGCKVNFYETSALFRLFEQKGYERTESLEDADIIVVNSCTVTENADRKAKFFVNKVKREKPDAVLAMCGCFCQAYPEKAAAFGADVMYGTANKMSLPDAVEEFLRTRQKKEEIISFDNAVFDQTEADEMVDHTRAFLKIEDGCDRYCTYCTIPKARGPVRSMPLMEVKHMCQKFAEKGYKEIVLVGINISAYGRDIECDLGDAVLAACSVPGIVRVRLGSLESDILSPEMLEKLSSCDKFCPHFHLSLQSGCDRTLKRMNRHYDTAEFTAFCGKLRNAFDTPTFTTDIIVGFPGETEADFSESVAYCSGLGFIRTHVFPYSRRAGTVAANLPDQLSRIEKQSRAKIMTDATRQRAASELKKFIGRKVRVILEQHDEGGWHTGYTDRYIPAKVFGSNYKPNDLVTGTVTAFENGCAVVEPD